MNLLSLALSTGLLAAVLAFAPHHPVAAQTSNDSHAGHHAGNSSADGTRELATGEVRRVSKDTNKITLRHGEIKSLDMRPMTMVFVVRDVSVLDTLKVVLIKFIVHHLHVKRYGFITRYYLRLRDLIRKRGGTITPSSTPADVRREAIGSDLRGRVSEFISMYEEYRFGGKSMTQEERTKYQELFTEIRKETTPDNS